MERITEENIKELCLKYDIPLPERVESDDSFYLEWEVKPKYFICCRFYTDKAIIPSIYYEIGEEFGSKRGNISTLKNLLFEAFEDLK